MSMIERLQVLVARAARRADAADGVLEERVAGEDLALDEQREHPAVWPGVCSGLTVSSPIVHRLAGLQVAGRGVDSSRSAGWISTSRSGQRSSSSASSATWS